VVTDSMYGGTDGSKSLTVAISFMIDRGRVLRKFDSYLLFITKSERITFDLGHEEITRHLVRLW
jgi:hypothetical protein